MLNRIIVIGRLTRDPEIKTTPSGAAVCTFSVAVDRNFTNNSGTKETDFIPVVTWRGLAETCSSYLSKGKLVAAEGRLQIRSYEDNKGIKRSISEIVADSVQFLSPKDSTQPSGYVGGEIDPPDDVPF